MVRSALVVILIAALAVMLMPVILVLPAMIGLRVFEPVRTRRIQPPRISIQRFTLFRVLSFRAPPAFA